MSCPRCKSDDWKLASFVYKSGLSSVNATSTSVGAGAGAGIGGAGVRAGMGSTRTTGQSQTELSALSAPPQEPNNTSAFVYWGSAIGLALIAGTGSDFLGWLVLAGAIVLWVKIKPELAEAHQNQMAEYYDALAKWEITRICQRCGQFYILSDELAEARLLNERALN